MAEMFRNQSHIMAVRNISLTTHQEKQIHSSGPHKKYGEHDERIRTIPCASQLNTFLPHNKPLNTKHIAIDKMKLMGMFG